MSPQQYIQKYPIITAQITKDELLVLLQQLSLVLAQNVAGDVVELGCYEGSSALFLSRMLQDTAPHKRLWLYDSFEGLPPKTAADASAVGMQFKQGQLHGAWVLGRWPGLG